MKASQQAHQFVLKDAPSPSAPLPDGEAPPPYNTLPPGATSYPQLPPLDTPPDASRPPAFAAGWSSPSVAGAGGFASFIQPSPLFSQQQQHPQHPQADVKDTKIGYMDFVPRLLRKRFLQDNEYENFGNIMLSGIQFFLFILLCGNHRVNAVFQQYTLYRTLIERANDWLEEHSWITVISCETITWSGLKVTNIYSDSSCFERSVSAARKTKNIVGMRLWFTQETFPNNSKSSNNPTVIECRTFIPRDETEPVSRLVERVNNILVTDPLVGSIFSVEVIPIPCRNNSEYRPGCMSPNTCFWCDDPEFNKVYAMCLRVFAKLVASKEGTETIGYKTFVPQYNGHSKENKGYEVFSSMMDRASRWMGSQQSVKFVSIKSINVKLKKKGPCEERCVFTEHLCAKNRENILTGVSSTTKYLRTIRAFYVVNGQSPENSPSHSSSSPPPLQQQIRLTSRTFMPTQIGVITSSVPVNMCNTSPYEETRKVLERINQWVQITGARIFHIETMAMRQTAISNLQTLGADATFSQNSLHNTSSSVEHWIHYIRVYIDGEYREPPGALSLVVPCVRPVY